MNKNAALKIAYQCIGKEIQRCAVDAHLQERFKADLPTTINALKKRTMLQKAIEELMRLEDE